MTIRSTSSIRQRVTVVDDGHVSLRRDNLAAEEPLELRIAAGGMRRTLAVTMRTPGNDFELAVGFLVGEGVIAEREAIRRITYCVDAAEDEQRYNVVNVELAAVELPETARLERHFVVGSACGVCGRATLDELRARCEPLAPGPVVTPELIYGLPERLREQQRLFASTGGLHAAGLFDETGELLAVREDVGRHNAVDKLIGWALLADRLPLQRCMLLVSGRASYEIVQKAAVARIPIVCAVSAPSSLAVALAHQFDITLIGFLRARRFNLYSSSSRIALGSPRTTDLR